MLAECDSLLIKAAKDIASRTGRVFSYDMARMLKTIELLVARTGSLNGKRIAIIGDGYGTLGSLVKVLFPESRVVFINLGRTLAFDAFYSNLAVPQHSHQLTDGPGIDDCSEDFTYIEAEKVFSLPLRADIFVNIASMQEMDPDVVRRYFDLIMQQSEGTYFYCCNRLEKSLPDGTVSRFFDYGWKAENKILVDELCPWYQEAPMNRPPFRYRFDGPTHHRLIVV
jgi:putative sugar O-methyltransferase